METLEGADGDRTGSPAPHAAGLATAGWALVPLLARDAGVGGGAGNCLGLCALLDSGQGPWPGPSGPVPTPGAREDEDPGCPGSWVPGRT